MENKLLINKLKNEELIFTVTAGQTGTKFLTEALDLLSQVTALHEPDPNFKNYLRAAQRHPEVAKKFWLEKKIPRIVSYHDEVYAETSHLACKGFLRPLINRLGLNPKIIVLRRNLRDIAKSMYYINSIPGRSFIGIDFNLSPEDPVNLPPQNWRDFNDYQLCYWYCLEMEKIAEQFIADFKEKLPALVETSLDEITTADGFEKLIDNLGFKSTPDIMNSFEDLQDKMINKKKQNKNNHNREPLPGTEKLAEWEEELFNHLPGNVQELVPDLPEKGENMKGKSIFTADRQVSNFDLILEDLPRVELSKDKPLVLLSGYESRFRRYLYNFIARGLAQEGIPSAFLDKAKAALGILPEVKTPEGPISSTIVKKNGFYHYQVEGIQQENTIDLDIDLPNKQISYQGLNFFSLVQASIARAKKCYTADLESPLINQEINQAIKTLKQTLALVKKIEKVAQKQAKKIFIVGNDPKYIPNGIFLKYIQNFDISGLIDFVHLTPGYKHYFGNFNRLKWLQCKNLTKYNLKKHTHLTKEEFVQLHSSPLSSEKYKKAEKYMNKALKPIKYNIEEANLPKKLKTWEKHKKPVIGLFTNMMYDRLSKIETNVFNGMKDWLFKTIDLFNELELPLLIKPHPAETNPDLENQSPAETAADLISSRINYDDFLLLKSNKFSVKQLLPYVNLGLVWRSNTALELAFNDIPAIVSAPIHWQKHLNFPSPDSMSEYKKLIKTLPGTEPSKELKQRIASFVINRYETPVHFPYLNTETFNWDEELLSDFLAGNKQPKIVKKLLEEIN